MIPAYEMYIGKTMTRKEMFNTFIDACAFGIPQGLDKNGNICMAVKHVVSDDEADELSLTKDFINLTMFYGRYSRKGFNVIENSNIGIEDIVGVWQTDIVDRGAMSDNCIIFLPDGKGLFGEANMSPYWCKDIAWYVEDNVITIDTEDCNFARDDLVFKEKDALYDISGVLHHFSSLELVGYNKYYRGMPVIPYDKRLLDTQSTFDSLVKDGIWKKHV